MKTAEDHMTTNLLFGQLGLLRKLSLEKEKMILKENALCSTI
jgi:hypothetical protein